MTLEPKEKCNLENERREMEKKLLRMNYELERLGPSTNSSVWWLKAKRSLTKDQLNTIKVKLGLW